MKNQSKEALLAYAEDVKKKHKIDEVHVIILPDPEDPNQDDPEKFVACYLKRPKRAIISAALTHQTNGQLVQGAEIVIENTWIEGDERIKTNDKLFFGAAQVAYSIIDIASAEIVKK